MTTRLPILSRPIRFALVGCGRISANHVEALRQHAGRAELVAVCDNQPAALAAAVAALPATRVTLRGLMAIPEPAGDLQAQRQPHRALRELLHTLQAQGLALDTLSMGMSADLEAAIAEGATLVRVGSAIFGAR